MKMLNRGFILMLMPAILTTLPGCLGRRDTASVSNPTPSSATPGQSDLIITPSMSPAGRVSRVNPQARFVVLNFPIGQMPSKGARLSVYRGGVKVGEVKVDEHHQLDNLVVADITVGTAQEGDEVRAD